MDQNGEIKALQVASDALGKLDDAAKKRVIQFLLSKYAASFDGVQHPTADKFVQMAAGNPPAVKLTQFESLAELFGKATVSTDHEKALLVAAFLQETQGKKELVSREINAELQHLGHGVKNITSTITTLMSRKPQLMIQTRKEGKSQQAQKKYRVTNEGMRAAQEFLNPSKEE